ncbi:MAG: hypothetical protein CMN76_00930 [Spirochaetaceae bacterium]|nr:hypothetical protein [Spirochaetaceae bacterium]|tara:strand:+ start:65713 stop:65928 length:216 start_codon:yes stop_codon:yes gene_type:complete
MLNDRFHVYPLDSRVGLPFLDAMNEKTAKLLKRYADKTGSNVRDLKKAWQGLNSKERFQKRQVYLQELKGK